MNEKTLQFMEQKTADSPLLHLERSEGLMAVVQPAGAELTAALAQGKALSLSPKDAQTSNGFSAVLDADAEALEQVLSGLSLAQTRAGRTMGRWGLCLAQDKLTEADGISAPLLLWPVRLQHADQCWLLWADSEGQLLNTAALAQLKIPAPEEGWSLNGEALLGQLDTALEGHGRWKREQGLWLGMFPLWLLELTQYRALTPSEGSVWAALEAGETAAQEPALDPEDPTDEESILVPLALDGRQMTLLRRLKQGESAMAQGGRGTGKTQLAAALMANAMGERQRVLLVSPSASDRNSMMDRMGSMGLDAQCLHIPTEGDRRQSVLHQFNLASQLRPATSSEDYFPLASSVTQLAQSLDRSAFLLHHPCSCGLTPFELICRYLEYRDTEGHLHIPETSVVDLEEDDLDRRLSCAEQLTKTAAVLGEPSAHPLNMVHAHEYDPQAAAALPQVCEALNTSIASLEQAVNLWLERTELEMPVTRNDWSRLQTAARLLLEWKDFPAPWAASPRVSLLGDAVKDLKYRTELVASLRSQICEAWGDKVLTIDAAQLEQQWKHDLADWSLPAELDREAALRGLLDEMEGLLNALEQAGLRWSKAVRSDPPTTRDSWERCYEVALELARWKEIPREWGDCKSLPALLWDVGELIDVGKQAKESKEVLLREWEESFLTLDGHDLLAQWNRENTGWGFGLLKRQGELRTQLEPHFRNQGKLTAEVLENGLRWLADYQQEIAQCEEIYHRWERELASVYKREDTVWIWLETARRVAEESHDWLSELTGSEDFLRNFGSNEEAVAAAQELQAQWERAREMLCRLDVLIGRTAQPDSPDWLNDRRDDCKRMNRLISIRNQVEDLAKEPVPMGMIGQTLEALAEYRNQEDSLENLYQRWETELDGLYHGTDTDWETLYAQAIRAVESDDRIAQLTGDLLLRYNLAGDPQSLSAAQTLIQAFDAVDAGVEQIETAFHTQLATDSGSWLEDLRRNSQILLDHAGALETWTGWISLCRQAEELGLRSFVAYYEQPRQQEQDPAPLFYKSIYRAVLLRELNRQHRQFSSQHFNDTLKQYAQQEGQFIRRTREELFHLCTAHAARALRSPDNRSEIQLLRRANETGCPDLSLQELLKGLPNLTAQFFPCVLAGPWDALRYFTPAPGAAPVFDYIVLEHAEQLPAQLGKLLLGLGRTGLMLSDGGRRMTTDAAPDREDLWKLCLDAGIPSLTLDTCYLPRQESLQWVDRTAFSLRHIPTPRPAAFAMACKTVVGRMENGINRPEAAAVIAEAGRQLENGLESLAIVAMTWQQRAWIRSQLNAAASEDPRLAQVPVLTPEEVISGSWDLVLLSLTLAPDRLEHLTGAQNIAAQWDGWYPISDAVSGARGAVWVFSSLDRQDWSRMKNVNPSLVEFLSYLEQEQVPVSDAPAVNQIQLQLCQSLENAGYCAVPCPEPISVQVSLKEHPDRAILGILLDDDRYSAMPRTLERELNRTQLLRDRGWKLCRVWSLDWWRSRREVLDGLEQLLRSLQQQKPAARPSPKRKAAPPVPLYSPANLTVMGIRAGEMASPAFRDRVTRVVEDTLAQEAPMSVSQLTERVLSAFGLDAQDPELKELCSRLWIRLGLRMSHEDHRDFVWPTAQDPDRWRSYRRSGSGEHYRSPEDVPCQEGASAACAVLHRRVTLSPYRLVEDTARELGYECSNEAALDCARRGVAHALFLGQIMETAIGSLVIGVRK